MQHAAPRSGRTPGGDDFTMKRAIAFILCMSLAGTGFAQSLRSYSRLPPPSDEPASAVQTPPAAAPLPDLGAPGHAEMRLQGERKSGESIMRDYRRDPDFVDDPEIVSYVNSVGQRLVAVSADAG